MYRCNIVQQLRSCRLAHPATRNISILATISRLQPPAKHISRTPVQFFIQRSCFATMTIEVTSLPLPPTADPSKFAEFGREVKGVNPGTLTAEQFKEIEELLYKVCSALNLERVLHLTLCSTRLCSSATSTSRLSSSMPSQRCAAEYSCRIYPTFRRRSTRHPRAMDMATTRRARRRSPFCIRT